MKRTLSLFIGQVGLGLGAGGVVCLISAGVHALSNPGWALSLLGHMYSYGGEDINSIGPALAFALPAFVSTVLSCSIGRLDRLRGALRITAGLCVVHLSFPLCVSFASYEIHWLDRQSIVEIFGLNHIVASLSSAIAGLVPVLFVREILKARRRTHSGRGAGDRKAARARSDAHTGVAAALPRGLATEPDLRST